jgi:hypothetical protein
VLLNLQATGDFEGARTLLDRLTVIRPEVQTMLDRLGDVAVDIRPRFVTAEELEREFP